MKRLLFRILAVLAITVTMASASVSNLTRTISYSCNGVATSFTFPFPITDDGDLEVYTVSSTGARTLLTLTTDFTVTNQNNNWSSGGTVNRVSAGAPYACLSPNTLVIQRAVPQTQPSEYVEGRKFSQITLMGNLDRLTMMNQDLSEEVGRSFKAPVGTSPLADLTPAANNYIGWNAAATGLENKSGPVATTATQYEVDALISYGSGTSFTQATIEAALTAIGTTNKVTLLLRPGTWVISSNADWSAYTNVTFKIVPGAVISHGAFTVNIPNVDAGLYRVFSGTGLVTLPTNLAGVPEWWGGVGDSNYTTGGGTDNYAAITAAIASTAATGRSGRAILSRGIYLTSRAIQLRGSGRIEGTQGSGIIRTDTTAETIDTYSVTAAVYVTGSYNHVRDVDIYGGLEGGQPFSVTAIEFGAAAAWNTFTNINIAFAHKMTYANDTVFMTKFQNVSGTQCDYGFDFSDTAAAKVALTFDTCYLSGMGYPWQFYNTVASTITDCQADNVNTGAAGLLPDGSASAFGAGWGATNTSLGIINLVNSQVNINGFDAEGSWGNGVVRLATGSKAVANGVSIYNCGSTWLPDYVTYATHGVGPFQTDTTDNQIEVGTHIIYPDWVHATATYVAKLVSHNYDQATHGAVSAVQALVKQSQYTDDASEFQGYGNRSNRLDLGEIGRWHTPTFSASDFSASASMTWTVAAGDVTAYEYTLVGKMMTVNFYITTSTVGGTPDQNLQLRIPLTATAKKRVATVCGVLQAAWVNAKCEVLAGGSYILIYSDAGAGANFAPSTDLTYVTGSITFEIE